jgi:outer membrane protein
MVFCEVQAMNRLLLSILIAGLLFAAAPSSALAKEGDWLIRAGWSNVDPKDKNLRLAPDTILWVDQDARFTFDISYFFKDNWALELLASDKFNHGFDVYVDNRAPSVLGGEVEHIPPTLSVQYHFLPDSRYRPYVGAGLNYTIFSGEKPDGLSLDNSFGLALQAGIDIGINENWFVNGVVRWIDIDSDASIGNQKIGTIEIDPWVVGAHVGYRFGRPAPAPAPVVAPEPYVAPPPPRPAPPPPPPPPPPVPDIITLEGVHFAFASEQITADERGLLREAVDTLKNNPQVRVEAAGHTDSVGSATFNQGLSERRARAVRDYLVANGIAPERVTYRGYGLTMPVADNATDEGRAANRRVELRVIK